MGPVSLRRYRAERLLRAEFEGMRGRVMAAVGARLRARGVWLDRADVEACYAVAWQGLYSAVLEGEEIENPAGWLVVVTFRRAIDEHRLRPAERESVSVDALEGEGEGWVVAGGGSEEIVEQIEDRMRLRRVLEGMRGRLSERERQAAALCYLQGFSRAEAAERMGVSARGMERIMEGRGPGRPGVTAKLGAIAQAIDEGRFCEQQASLMRALAFGVLSPGGERHRLAVAHQRSCPACRAYVLSLRGLAAAMPPVLLPGSLAGVLAAGGTGTAAGMAGTVGADAGGAAGATAGGAVGTATGTTAGATAGGTVATGGAGGASLPFGAATAKLGLAVLAAAGVGVGVIALEHGVAVGSSKGRPVVAGGAGQREARASVGLGGGRAAVGVGGGARTVTGLGGLVGVRRVLQLLEGSGSGVAVGQRLGWFPAWLEFGPEWRDSGSSAGAATNGGGRGAGRARGKHRSGPRHAGRRGDGSGSGSGATAGSGAIATGPSQVVGGAEPATIPESGLAPTPPESASSSEVGAGQASPSPAETPVRQQSPSPAETPASPAEREFGIE